MEDLIKEKHQLYISVVCLIRSFKYISKMSLRIKHKMLLDLFYYLVPWMRFNLWEFKFCIIRIHAFNLFPCWSAQNLSEQTTNGSFTC